MSTLFHIPRLNDQEIIVALDRVRQALKAKIRLNISVNLPKGASIGLPEENPGSAEQLKPFFALAATAIEHFYLRDAQGRVVAEIRRKLPAPMDETTIQDDWINQYHENQRPEIWMAVLSHVRTELKVPDLEASLRGTQDDAWNRYLREHYENDIVTYSRLFA